MLINFLKQVKMAINLKKGPGRPKKVKNDNVVIEKSNLEIKLEQAQANLAVKDMIISDLEIRLDNSFKEQEDMLKELDRCIYATIHHCSQVECTTGKLTLHDVDYSVDLIKRILTHKFKYQSPNIEL